MKKVLFIDRDGTLIKEPADERIDSLEKLEFFPGVFRGLDRIASELDYELVMISNQDALGTEEYPQECFDRVQTKILKAFENEGIRFSEVLIDPTTPEENANTRKPGLGMLTGYFQEGIDLKSSFVIGDRSTDIEMARRLGAGGIFIHEDPAEVEARKREAPEAMVLAARDWDEIHRYLSAGGRKARVHRKTSETDVLVELDLDGSGSAIDTGIGFFDHMIDQLARHGDMGLTIQVEGDLQVDYHHSVEDTALALGEALHRALGERRGIERYAFLLPMDESAAQVALDLGGRPYFVWEVEWEREQIGEMPTELIGHFFKSFTDTAQCNLQLSVDGENDHHKAEALFKGLARTLRDATRMDREGPGSVPSTKGSI
jgi:imidazoleglycerol-phosphate dehydratase/histidinol-phosphatase